MNGAAAVSPVRAAPSRVDATLERELADFVATEAALLDAGRHDEWLALFTNDGRYWVPLKGAEQSDPIGHNSLAYEDRLLLALRIERLKSPRAHSQQPRSRCQHVLQRATVVDSDGGDDGSVELRTPFLYVESREGDQILLTGSYRHTLVRIDDVWKIRLKRVDLLDAERPLAAIQLFV